MQNYSFENQQAHATKSIKVFHDQIADVMNDKWIQSLSPLNNYEFQNQDDKGFNSQTLQLVGISLQILSESLQGNKDENKISFSSHGGY